MKLHKKIISISLSASLCLGLILPVVSVFSTQDASAADTRNFEAGNIMSDMVFTDYNSMSASQIQSFLESKNSVCLVNFKTLSLNDQNGDGLGDEPYGKGTNEQVSAATLIWQAAQLYKINPKVILTTLQKEQGLITRTDCPDWRYNTALGYGCPDTAPCSSAAYGFTRQIDYGVWHFRGFFDDSYPIPPIKPGTRAIRYNPDVNCGSQTITIQNKATAALYSYTPYQPNAATLAAAPGQLVNCGAYGNLNFWRYFTDWFGSTTNPQLNYSLVKSTDSPAVYLQTSSGKHYIPSGAILAAWGLGDMAIQQVSQSLIDSLPSGPWVDKLLKDDWNNYFIVEGGTLHYVRDSSYLALWGMQPEHAVQSLGLTRSLPATTWAGRFVQDVNLPNGHFWLLDNGKKRRIADSSLLYQWRYTPDQLTYVSSAFLDSIPTLNGDVTPFASDGSASYLIDSGRKLSLSPIVKSAAYGAAAPVAYSASTLSYLPTETASQFITNPQTGQWFMLENGKKHYIPRASLAELWGKKPHEALTSLSSSFINGLTTAEDLSLVVQTANPSAYWLIDGTRRYIADPITAGAWIGEGVSPPLYSNESISALKQGSNATNTITASGSPYTYMVVNGYKHYLSSSSVKDAWAGTVMTTNAQLVNTIPEGIFMSYTAQDETGKGYLLMSGKKYPIDNSFKSTWGINASTIKLSSSFLANYPNTTTLKAFIKINGVSYVMTEGGIKVPISRHADTYLSSTLGEVTLPNDYFPSGPEASFLIKSVDSSDTRVWLMNRGKKLPLSFTEQVSFGYLSKGVNPTPLNSATLSTIPDEVSPFSVLIQKQGSGIKLLNFGSSLGFPDGNTLTSFMSNNGVLLVSGSVFDSISLTGSVSRVITDDLGRYFLVQNGQKRWISNGTAYAPYTSIPRVYLYGTTSALIPDGPSL